MPTTTTSTAQHYIHLYRWIKSTLYQAQVNKCRSIMHYLTKWHC